jgi:di/tricarboxylate transporter
VVGTTLMTNFVTKAVAATILTPIAIDLARALNLEPVPLLAVIATSLAFTFLNPFSHQSNLMVMGPGGYTAQTFIRFGIPIVLVVMAATIGIGSLLLTR